MMSQKTGRSSIFEYFTCLKSAPEDESHSGSQSMPSSESSHEQYPSLMLGRMPMSKNTVSVELPDVEEFEAEQETTLWMSCSPGHDSSDNDAESRLAVDVVDVSSDDDDDDDDDVLPNSQLTHRSSVFKTAGCWSNDGRRLDGKSSSKCMPEPQMPVSAYALFYNDARAAIVGGNSKTNFTKIAKTVATMWDHLDEASKEDYKRKAKSRCFAKSSTSAVRSHDQDTQIKTRVRKAVKSFLGQKELAQRRMYKQSCSKKFNTEDISDLGVKVLCHRPGCLNIAVDDPRWSKDYCSSQCIVTHCRDVFNAWVSERQGVFQNM